MAAKGLYINSTEQGFTVRGVNNNFFPDNATLAYPANSVILITDESDMATFRSASNYDVLFSALIKDININGERVTKDNIIETFNEAANKPSGGGGGNPDAFTSVQYDGKNELKFYNDKGAEVANVDVTPFIKDGMVEDVEISDGNLVIHFNTDSDIKDIYIPLTEIFDPEAYYTKQEIDKRVIEIRDTIDEKEEVIANALTEVKQDIDEKEEVIATSLNALNEDVENLSNNKADASALTAHIDNTNVHFTGTQKSNYDLLEGNYYQDDNWDIMPQSAFNDFSSDFTTAMGQFDQRITANANAIATKANASDVYTKTESDAKYATQTVVNEEIAARIEAIRDVNTALQSKADKSDTYTKTQVDDALASKANTADLATVATSGSYNDLTDKPVIPEGAVVDAALSDTSENPVQNKVVKGALDAKQDALVYYSENEYDEETGEEATAVIQVIGQGDSSGNSAEVNVQPYSIALSASSEGEDPMSTTLVVTSDDVTINDERVLTESDGVYYINFETLTTQGIHDADWDGMVAAINAHRPIYAGLGNRYYTAECLYQDGSNIIRMTASDELNHYFYMFTKRGTNDYTMTYEVRPYVTEVEKHTWSAKQDALVSGTNIKTINNQSIIGSGNIEIQGGGGEQQQADWNQTDTTAVDYIKNKPDLSGKVNGLGGITNIQNIVSREYERLKHNGTINSNTLYVVKPTEWEVVADDGNGTFEFTTGDSQQPTSQFLSEISSASLQMLSESYRGSDGYEGYTVTFADLVTGETYTATPHTDSGASVIIFNATIDGETVTIAMQINTTNYTLSGMTLDSQSQRYLEISFQHNA